MQVHELRCVCVLASYMRVCFFFFFLNRALASRMCLSALVSTVAHSPK